MEFKAYLSIRGNAARLARALSLTEGQVSQWKKGIRRVPTDYCPAIEHITGMRVTREILRPDVDWTGDRVMKKTEAA